MISPTCSWQWPRSWARLPWVSLPLGLPGGGGRSRSWASGCAGLCLGRLRISPALAGTPNKPSPWNPSSVVRQPAPAPRKPRAEQTAALIWAQHPLGVREGQLAVPQCPPGPPSQPSKHWEKVKGIQMPRELSRAERVASPRVASPRETLSLCSSPGANA